MPTGTEVTRENYLNLSAEGKKETSKTKPKSDLSEHYEILQEYSDNVKKQSCSRIGLG